MKTPPLSLAPLLGCAVPCCSSQLTALYVHQDIAHDTQHGRDRLLGFRQPDELDADSDIPTHRGRRVPDRTLESDVNTTPVSGQVHRDQAAGIFRRVRVIERDPETEHGDIDDPTVAPRSLWLTREPIRS